MVGLAIVLTAVVLVAILVAILVLSVILDHWTRGRAKSSTPAPTPPVTQ
jgi:hypothetical protein